ncbi:tetratricopeptide repeat protein [Algoriphagus aquimarinus]|uniref:Tetratricopeptide repeat-containing protein n=1 Tax=Algoriphagus aquimarinus TaxID=237018 RepID=A0A1I1B4F9_9BACT|nr:tetratricopeptide repeat protein [Algoriphagus aquimarinus]SFB44652.1 Tetratricopeptide repeat-containing protein [Algoriphagus aquimarinus]|tara:strand:+ start:87939 stop:88643 length:705 start_codon:yes stop_codon:yes gene_type:complete
MKRVLFMLLMAFCASTTIAQTADSVARLDPKLKKTLNNSDQAAYQLALRYNDIAAAKTFLYNLIIRNPDDLRYVELLGTVYYEAGQAMSAALVSMDVLQINDKSVTSLEIAAYSLEQVGALEKSLPYFESLYLLGGDNFSLYKSAFIQYSLKKYQEAMNSVNMLVKNAKPDEKVGFPKSQTENQEVSMKAAALNLKGMIYLDQGSKVEAKAAFEEALSLDPDFGLVKENLAKTN